MRTHERGQLAILPFTHVQRVSVRMISPLPHTHTQWEMYRFIAATENFHRWIVLWFLIHMIKKKTPALVSIDEIPGRAHIARPIFRLHLCHLQHEKAAVNVLSHIRWVESMWCETCQLSQDCCLHLFYLQRSNRSVVSNNERPNKYESQILLSRWYEQRIVICEANCTFHPKLYVARRGTTHTELCTARVSIEIRDVEIAEMARRTLRECSCPHNKEDIPDLRNIQTFISPILLSHSSMGN